MAGSKPQLLSGARGKLIVAGEVLAFVTDVSINSPANVRGIHTFGSVNARSVEPLSVGPVNVTIGRVIPMNDAKGNAVDSSNIALGIKPIISQMLIAEDITIELQDKVTGKTVSSVKNCRWAGDNINLAAGQISNQRIQLLGIYDTGEVIDGTAQNNVDKLGFE